jgi:asparagine synthase (glutamine-hydrolysing)
MCGIAGLVGPGADATVSAAMARCLQHRGPDGEGLWSRDGVAFAHRRLSIIDLARGAQPMHSASADWTLIYNGELYNYRELRAGDLADYPYRTDSDTEVILAGLDRWGEAVLHRLKGMFAIAAYHHPTHRTLLARDGQGIKPLYFGHLGDGTLAFGSEVAALLGAGLAIGVDERALDTFLDIRFVPAPATMFRGVRKLRAGHRLWVDAAGAVSEQEPFVPPAPAIDRRTRRAAHADLLRDALLTGVASQLVADVPVGILLSGGVDSAAVAAAAVRAKGQISTFCIGYEQDHWSNEFAEARETARLLGTEHHELRIDADAAINGMRALVRHLEEPVVTTSLFSYFLLCQAVAQHRKVVLSGQGADEPWGGYGRHRVAALRGLAAPAARLLPRHAPVARWGDTWSRVLAAVGPGTEPERWAALHMLFAGKDRASLRAGSAPGKAGAAALAPLATMVPADGSFLERLLAAETRSSLPDNLLMLGDKLSMAWGLEVRVPLLDPDYLRLVEATPGRWRRGGALARNGKALHKEVCRTLLPAAIVDRPKKGFQSPIATWLRDDLGAHLAEMIDRPRSFTRNYLDLATARSLLDRHRAARTGSLERQLFALWVLEEWNIAYLENDAA